MSRWRRYTSVGVALAFMSSLLVLVGAVAPAQAATPEYEITGQWVNPPDTISRGNPVVAEWRINVNDAEQPPSNDPVDNVTAEFHLEKAFFDDLPDMCETEGVEPPSSISEDGRTLVCNFGTVNMGRAIVLQTPVVADGITGDEVVLDGTSPGGENVELDPIPIVNPFAMDIRWASTTRYYNWNDASNPEFVDVDLQWTLRLGQGSDPGPNRVSYLLDISEVNGHDVGVGTHARNPEFVGCSPFNLGRADGHPWSPHRTDLPPEHE